MILGRNPAPLIPKLRKSEKFSPTKTWSVSQSLGDSFISVCNSSSSSLRRSPCPPIVEPDSLGCFAADSKAYGSLVQHQGHRWADYIIFLTTLYDIIFWWSSYNLFVIGIKISVGHEFIFLILESATPGNNVMEWLRHCPLPLGKAPSEPIMHYSPSYLNQLWWNHPHWNYVHPMPHQIVMARDLIIP